MIKVRLKSFKRFCALGVVSCGVDPCKVRNWIIYFKVFCFQALLILSAFRVIYYFIQHCFW